MFRYCKSCVVSLLDRPCILMGSDRYCFKCAKQKVEEEKQLKYTESIRAAHEWRNCRDQFFDQAGGKDVFWESLTLAGFGAVLGYAWLKGFGALIGGVVSFGIRQYFWSRKLQRLEETFRATNPEPKELSSARTAEVLFVLDRTEFNVAAPVTNLRPVVLQRDGYTCQNCGVRKQERELEMHHVEMRSKGGPDILENLVTLCLECHDREDWFGHVRAYPTTRK